MLGFELPFTLFCHMRNIPKQPIPSERAELKPIVKALEEVTEYGRYDMSQVFSDWLIVTEMGLRMLPQHAVSIAANGTLAADSSKDAEALARIREKYGKSFHGMYRAFYALMEVAHPMTDRNGNPMSAMLRSTVEIRDHLGPLFEFLGKANAGLGQFFTPEHICALMANLTLDGKEDEVYRAMEKAIRFHPLSGILYPVREGWITKEIAESLYHQVLPRVIAHYEAISIMDPCVGSGGLLLAAAAQFPRWMVHAGLVQFRGIDISNDCVLMTKINIMLFGLNGWGTRYTAAVQLLKSKRRGVEKTEEIQVEKKEQESMNEVLTMDSMILVDAHNTAILHGNTLSEFMNEQGWRVQMEELQKASEERERQQGVVENTVIEVSVENFNTEIGIGEQGELFT